MGEEEGERERERGKRYGSFVRNVDLSNMKMNLMLINNSDL